MIKRLWWKIRDWIDDQIYGPAECPKEVKDSVAKANANRAHLMTMEECIGFASGNPPPNLVVTDEVCVLRLSSSSAAFDPEKESGLLLEAPGRYLRFPFKRQPVGLRQAW